MGCKNKKKTIISQILKHYFAIQWYFSMILKAMLLQGNINAFRVQLH